MKKALLFVLFFACSALFAQEQSNLVNVSDLAKKEQVAQQVAPLDGSETTLENPSVPLKAPADGNIVGTTWYDLQTNSGMQRRLHLEEDGTLHAVWTMGTEDGAGTFPERGTGYNVRVDGTWGPQPTERIEGPVGDGPRVGWPTVNKTASGRLFAMAHVSGGTTDQGLSFTYKDEGDTEWTNNIVTPTDPDATWVRIAVDGDNIYAISSHFDVDFDGFYQGIGFFRSLDGGDTWEGPISLPMDEHFANITVDSYPIDARDGKIAFVHGGYANQLVVYTSENNGDSWETDVLLTNSDPFALDANNLMEPVGLMDEMSLVIDDAGDVHVAGAWVYNFKTPEATQDGGPFYATERAGILYWKENSGMDAPVLIGETVQQDWNGDGTDSLLYDPAGDFTLQWNFTSSHRVGHASIAVDEDNVPYIAYSATVDAHQSATDSQPEKSFREIFVVKGDGDGWAGPYNVSNDATTDDIFCSIPRRVYNGEVNVIYQSDSEAGIALPQGNPAVADHPDQESQMLVATFDVDDIETPDYISEDNGPHLNSVGAFVFGVYTTYQGCALEGIGDFAGMEAWDFPDGLLTDQIMIEEVDYNTPTEAEGVDITNANGFLIGLSVEDSEGNMASDSVLVIIYEDIVDPEITLLCPGGGTDCETIGVVASDDVWEDPGFIFSDNSTCPGFDETSVVVDADDVDLSEPGTYIITYTATDPAGNSTTVTRTINVFGEDLNPPTVNLTFGAGITDNGDGTYTVEGDPNAADLTVGTDPGDDISILAEDDINPNVTVDIDGDIPISLGTLTGTEPIELVISASDGVNPPTVETIIVNVVDTTPPVVSLAPNAPSILTTACGEGMLIDPLVTFDVDDNFISAGDALVFTFDESNVDFNTDGNYDVGYSINDPSGNTSNVFPVTYIVEGCSNPPENWAIGVEDIALSNAVQITPNPSNGLVQLTIDGAYATANVSVVNVQGKEIRNIENVTGTTTLNLTSLAAGAYFVKVSTNNAVAVKKIVIE